GRAREEPAAVAQRRHRFRDGQEQARCADCTDGWTTVANRLGEWRSLHGGLLDCVSRRRLSACHRARGLPVWLAGRTFLLWPRVECTDSDQVCLCFRASNKVEASAEFFGHREVGIERRVSTASDSERIKRPLVFVSARAFINRGVLRSARYRSRYRHARCSRPARTDASAPTLRAPNALPPTYHQLFPTTLRTCIEKSGA